MLRLHGGTEGDRLIPIPVGKSSIGSGPRCSARLTYDGVRPLHCLITRDDQGLRVRRWADNILLNGVTFDEASLAPGDRLTIGSIELEVMGKLEGAETTPDDAASTSSAAAQSPASETDADTAPADEMIAGSDELPPSISPVEPAPVPAAATFAEPSETGTPNVLTRSRRRKLLAALRFHHQTGIQLERAVANLEQQVRDVSAGQASSTAENAHLTDTLATLVDQVREYRREQTQLEQRHADWLEQSRGWESRLEEQQQKLQGLEREADRSRTLGDSMHRRGRKLVASLRKGRDSHRALDERLAGLEQKTQESSAERERLREQLIEQQSAQETQSIAWNAVVEATDRLSNNYKQLATENTRLASEIEKFAAEKAAASETLAMLREQYQKNQQRQAEFDVERGQWRDELRAWETRVIERDEWADRFERELKGIRSSFDVPTVPIAQWKSLSEQVALLTSQHSESIRQQAAWERRVADCETRLADGGEQIGAVQQEVQSLRTETQEQAGRTADWTAIADQVASLRSQQAEWENERRTVRGRVDDCEVRLAERLQQLGDFERQMAELRATCEEHSAQATGWKTLSSQVVILQDQQSEWEQRRSAWQGRIEQSETRLADLGRQLAAFEHAVDALKTGANEPPFASADWLALTEQVASLRDEQTELAQQRAAWDARLGEWETEWAAGVQQFGDLTSEVEQLRSAHHDQATQVTEISSLFEQLAALQRQQVEFDYLRTEWQNRISEWESQLQQRLRQFETLEGALQQLQTIQREQAALVVQLASQQRVPPQSDEAAHQSAAECNLSEHSSTEPASSDQVLERDDIAEQPTASSTTNAMGLVDEVAVTEPVVEADAVQAAPPAPVSYLEKYAHIFEEDDVDEPAGSLQPPTSHESPYSNRNETDQSEPAAEDHLASHDDEESVEQYMAKLMSRIRGDAHGHAALSGSTTVETDVSDMPVSKAHAVDAAEPNVTSQHDPGSTTAIVDEATNATLLNDIEEMKPKTPAPVFAADMQALRALANQSARHAIGVHAAHQLRRTATTRCVIAVLAVLSGVYLFIYSPGWQSLQFAGACVAMVAGLYWIKLSVGSLAKAIRLGAFQNFDDEGEDPVHPPLPIDVDRSNVDL